MAALIILCTFVLLGVVVLVVSAPLRQAAARRAGRRAADGEEEEGRRFEEGAPAVAGTGRQDGAAHPDLEAAREAKYREIRDAELDYRTGKLSERDYRELDAELRGEALAILDEIEAAGATPTDASAARSRSRRTRRRRRPSSD